MAEGSTCFKDWLYADLKSLGLDEEVYGDYIIGTLDVLKENSIEEKVEAVMELLSEVLTDDCRVVCQRIVEQWIKENPPVKKKKTAPTKPLTMQDHVDKFLKQATPLAPPTTDDSSSSHQPQMSVTEKKQLLMQYGCASDDEDEHEANIETSNKEDIFVNTNKSAVSVALKQQREEQKIVHEIKLEQDKRSREMQRQRQQERKEKEKKRTQKQERKR